MNSKPLILLGVLASLLMSGTANGYTVFCTNCSNLFMQALDRATNLQQLTELYSQTSNAIAQTTQQISMVQNMIQNTTQLPASLRTELSGQLMQLASLTNQLRTQRGDFTSLGQIFNTLFPDQSMFQAIAHAEPADIEAANRKLQAHWDTWSRSVDQASEATFKLSGQQLADLENSGEMQRYIDNLIATPEGQMQAMQASNQLAAIQIQEARQLRELMATSAQSALAAQMKAEKESQADKEWWRKATDTSDPHYADAILENNRKPLP
jgi:P-type conjugative transfer protein TrbJ